MHESSASARLRASRADEDGLAPGHPHWWQWPTILSLDATAVALLWQWLIARVVDAPLGWPERLVLGSSVWLAYAADRWIAGWRLGPAAIKTQRHYFAQRWRWPLATGWIAVLLVDVTVALARCTAGQLAAGVVLLAMVLMYLLSHQLVHRHRRWRAPKELCVAILLSGGVALFLTTPQDMGALAAPIAIFGTLCFCNCALISSWERDVDKTHGETSLALAYRWGGSLSRRLPWCLAASAAVAAAMARGPLREVVLSALASSALLGGVDRLEPQIGRQLARVCADVALLTPLWPLLHRG